MSHQKTEFNLQEQLGKALEWTLEKMKEIQETSPDWYGGHYFSATDLERRVRAAAAEIADKVPYGTRQNYGYGVRVRNLGKESLLTHCRSFLLRQVQLGKLRADQPSGYHTVSGLRFRPVDWDLTEAEKKTQAIPREERFRWIKHYDPEYPQFKANYSTSSSAICQKNKKKSKTFFFRSKRLYITNKPDEVTCKLCLKMMKKLPHPLVPELLATTPPLIVADFLEEHGNDDLANSLRDHSNRRQ